MKKHLVNLIQILVLQLLTMLLFCSCNAMKTNINYNKIYNDYMYAHSFDNIYAISWVDVSTDNNRYAAFQKYEITDFNKDGVTELFIIYRAMSNLSKHYLDSNYLEKLYSMPFIKESYTIEDGKVVPFRFSTDYGSGAHWDYYCFLLNDDTVLEYNPGGYMSASFNVVDSNGTIKTISYETPDHVEYYYYKDGHKIDYYEFIQVINNYINKIE